MLKGDVIDLYGYLYITDYDPADKKKRRAAALGLEEQPRAVPVPEPPKLEFLPSWIWEKFLPPTSRAIEYMHKRGIEDEQILKYKLGSARLVKADGTIIRDDKDAMIAIPTWQEGKLVCIKLRWYDGPIGARYYSMAGSHPGLWGYDNLENTQGPVLLVKSELAAIIASRWFPTAVGATMGENNDIRNIKNVVQALGRRDVLVIGDNDELGVQQAYARAALLGGIAKFPPAGYDVDTWLLERKEAVPTIEEWLKSVASE
jgi:hypothetical protein